MSMLKTIPNLYCAKDDQLEQTTATLYSKANTGSYNSRDVSIANLFPVTSVNQMFDII